MAGHASSSCILCRVPLSYTSPPPYDDEYEGDDDDWRNIRYHDLRVHGSCLAIATTAAGDREQELFAKICNPSLRYGLFPLLATIADPASCPNQIPFNLALALVRKINRLWRFDLPEELCGFVAYELMYDQLNGYSPIPTLWHSYTRIKEQYNLSTVLRNVETLLAWKATECSGSRLSVLPHGIRLVQSGDLRDWNTSALRLRSVAEVMIDRLPECITLHFNLALEQKYLVGITVNGRSLGYKGVLDSDVTLKCTDRSKGLFLLFDQWGFQEGCMLDGSVADIVASFSCKPTAFAVLYWPEHWTTISATFDVSA